MLKVVLSIGIFCSSVFQLFGQSENQISEEIKILLFSSIEYDGTCATKGTWNQWTKVAENHFEYLEIERSSIMCLYKPVMTDSITGEYEIQMYKLPSENSENQSRYLMWFKDFSSEVWLRVGGYVENDLHLLFGYLRKQKIRKSQLRRMIREWCKGGKIFEELDWECLYKGYLKGSAKYECYRSASYVTINDVSIGFDPLTNEDLNSVFSRIPLYGRFR